MKHKREYYIPKGSIKVSDRKSDAVAYVKDRHGQYVVVGFCGSAQKPTLNAVFRKPESRERKVREFFESRQLTLAFREKCKAERRATGRGVKVGDLLRRSWGYDQTNIDYWQVTALVGETMVEIRELAQEVVQWDGHDRGKCAPIVDKFAGPVERRVAKAGQVKINHYAWAYKMETEIEGVKTYAPSRFSTYA